MKTKQRILTLLKRLALAYVGICLFLWLFQSHFIFIPFTRIQSPENYGLEGYSDLTFAGKAGALQAWYRPAKKGYPTIVYFQGTGGNQGNRARYYRLFTEAGFGVLAPSYRGYGKSEGSPSEEGLYEDSRLVMDYAQRSLALAPGRIILYGESLGAAVAVQLATEYPVGALVLQSPFSTLESCIKATFPWLPIHWMLEPRFDSLSKIGNIHAPLLLLHGEQDAIVPVDEGKALFEQAPPNKRAVYFPGVGHMNFSYRKIRDLLLDFSRQQHLLAKQPSSP